MIINVKASGSTDFGKYLTDRDKDAYTIIEGDAQRIDRIASLVLKNNPSRKTTHYSYVLSFKETDITKEQIVDAYLKFRELMFSNYHPDELEMLSVIHWDDNKPHIHCAVLNSSQLDSDRDLRLYRGYPDFPRIEAVQETINYTYDFASPFDNYNLLLLTKEQKKRDWLVKKGKDYYPVFDDQVHDVISEAVLSSNNYQGFLTQIEAVLGTCSVFNVNKFNKDTFTTSKLLKERVLILDEHNLSDGGKYTYTSKLFDEKWFNKNLPKLKKALQSTKIENIKYATHKKSAPKYREILEETTQKHLDHLTKRKVGRKYAQENIDKILLEKLNDISRIDLSAISRESAEASIEKFLHHANEKLMEKFIEDFPLDFEVHSDHVLFFQDEHRLYVYNQDLREMYLSHKEKVSSGNFSKHTDTATIDPGEIRDLLPDIRSNKNKARARVLLEEFIEQQKILSSDELISLLNDMGLEITRTGNDTRRGKYLTMDTGHGVFRLYSDSVYEIYQRESLSESVHLSKRDKKLESELEKDAIRSYIKSVYLEITGEQGRPVVSCVNDYRLLREPTIENGYIESNGFLFTKDMLKYKSRSANSYERMGQSDDGAITVKKTLNRLQTGKNIADLYFLQGQTDLYVDNSFDETLKNGIIERVKEMDYDISLWEKNPNYSKGTSLIFSNTSSSAKRNGTQPVQKLAEQTASKVEKYLGERAGQAGITKNLEELDKLQMVSEEDHVQFRQIIKEIASKDMHLLNAICNTMGIVPIRSGQDDKKGEYGTFSYKGKKVAVYGEALKEIIKKSQRDLDLIYRLD